jgi:hypothetical protein
MDVRSNLAFSGGAKITGLPSSSANGEAVVHEQLQAAIEGISWKDSCRVASTANITISAPGATIDAITMATNDRFLAKDQSTASQNGIYIWNGAATPATRAPDASTFAEIEGAVTTVEEGTAAGVSYRQTQVNGTIDTNTVTWTVFGTSASAASETVSGIAELATQAETDTGTDDLRIVTPLKLKTSVWARKQFSALIGDGSATQIDVTHNLGTVDIEMAVRVNSTGQEIICDKKAQSTTVARFNFVTAPSSNELRVTIQA